MLLVDNIEVNFKNFYLGPIKFNVEKGDYFVILGPTGAGKTILLETIMGFYPVNKGNIFLENINITHLPPNKRNISMVYQDFVLFPHLTVRENMEYGMIMKKIDKNRRDAKVKELAEILQIEKILDRYPNTLSGGEKQRVAIGRALATNPKILLLDEPLSSLHPNMRMELRKLLKKLNEMGVTMIHVTHDRDEAAYLSNKIAIMFDGKIEQIGNREKIFSKPRNIKIAKFVGMENILRGNAKIDGKISIIDLEGIKIYCSEKIEGKVTIGIRPEDIIISQSTIKSSARNVIPCIVNEIENFGNVYRVYLKCGKIFLCSILTKQALEELSLKNGMNCYAVFKASSVHVFR